MKTTYITIAAIIALLAMAAVAVTTESDDVDANTNSGEIYKLTYYAEIEGDLISDKTVAVTSGNQITIYAIPGIDGYTFAGWEYNGVIYKVGEKFTMPECDATLNAKWETTVVASEVVAPGDVTSIMMIFVAILAIGAIVASMIVMKMRSSALKNI